MSGKQFLKWSKHRKLGEIKITVISIIFFNILPYLTSFLLNINNLSNFSIGFSTSKIALYTLCGAMHGICMWNRREKEYKIYLNKNNLA